MKKPKRPFRHNFDRCELAPEDPSYPLKDVLFGIVSRLDFVLELHARQRRRRKSGERG